MLRVRREASASVQFSLGGSGHLCPKRDSGPPSRKVEATINPGATTSGPLASDP